jgi:glycerophosphoryl diester phosphodiesterase
MHYPENTLPAFLSAVEMGVDVIETDVHLSKDGVLVIWHDPTLDRNTNGSGRIEDHTLEELNKFDAGYTFTKDGGESYPFRGTGVRLATLEEALQACPEQRFNIDLKSKTPAIVDEFISVVRRNDAQDRVVGASFHLANLRALRAKARKSSPALPHRSSALSVSPEDRLAVPFRRTGKSADFPSSRPTMEDRSHHARIHQGFS